MLTIDPVFSPWPSFTREEIDAVGAVLQSNKVNYWTGEIGRDFERAYAAYTGRSHGVAVANGSVALELGLLAFGIGAGDEVITSSRTYVASASCAVMRGAIPVVADVDHESQCITAETIRAVLTPRTRAIIPVHLAGWPCPMDEIMALAAEHNLVVIEDCAQAHGARYKGKPVGSFGHAGAFSFCQDKIITTGGEGGMLVLGDEQAWERAWAYKDIGRSYDATYRREHPIGFRWVTESFGTNWRMTEMQAALGRIQLGRLDAWVGQRRANAHALNSRLAEVPGVRLTVPSDEIYHSYYKYYLFLDLPRLGAGWNRDRVMNEISACGVPCSVGSCSEIYLERAFKQAGFGPTGRLTVSQQLGESSLAFMVHPTLSAHAIELTADVISQIMKAAVR